MAATTYSFEKTPVNIDRLTLEIQDSSIVIALDHITVAGSALSVTFKDVLSAGDETTLGSLVAAHSGEALPVQPTDSDGAALVRNKMAASGWTFQYRSIELETSILASLRDNAVDPVTRSITPNNHCTVKCYSDSVEITDQATADTSAVWTVLDFEPPFDVELVGGAVRLLTDTTDDIYLWIVGAPDIPAASGGTKVFVNETNLNYIGTKGSIEADGRSSKRLNYDSTLHTGKIRVLLNHAAGLKCKMQISLQFYKA